MIIFKSVRYKNFLSTGNAITEIQLNRSQTTLLTAKNGGGKSTVIDAIVFALFGTPFRKINKPMLVNTINKRDCVTEIDFSIGNAEYTVRRGIKPNIFEVYKNGQLVNQAADAREYQQHLEQNILKMNKSSFCQIVVLGSATYVPFMVLNPYQRRGIIEDLLDISVFSSMNTLLKKRVTDNKDATQEARYQIELASERIESQASLIKRLSEDQSDRESSIQAKMTDATHRLEEAGIELVVLQQKQQNLTDSISDRSSNKKSIDQLNLIRDKLHDKVASVDKQIKFFHDTDTCMPCTQKIDEEFRARAIAEREGNKIQISAALPDLEAKYADLVDRFDAIERDAKALQKISNQIATTQAAMSTEMRVLHGYEKELLTIKSTSREGLSSDLEKLGELKRDRVTQESNLETLLRQNTVLTAASALLKDGGIKSKIIKQYIPIMNKLINKYLAAFDFFVQFELDENFNETIKSRFRDDFGYQNFSEGEKLRIDLSILFAWRAVAKMRNSASTNLLIMDEILDGALDANGMDEFLGVIQDMNKDSNVFVISHRGDQLFDKFHSVIKFEKQGNFSRVVQ